MDSPHALRRSPIRDSGLRNRPWGSPSVSPPRESARQSGTLEIRSAICTASSTSGPSTEAIGIAIHVSTHRRASARVSGFGFRGDVPARMNSAATCADHAQFFDCTSPRAIRVLSPSAGSVLTAQSRTFVSRNQSAAALPLVAAHRRTHGGHHLRQQRPRQKIVSRRAFRSGATWERVSSGGVKVFR